MLHASEADIGLFYISISIYYYYYYFFFKCNGPVFSLWKLTLCRLSAVSRSLRAVLQCIKDSFGSSGGSNQHDAESIKQKKSRRPERCCYMLPLYDVTSPSNGERLCVISLLLKVCGANRPDDFQAACCRVEAFKEPPVSSPELSQSPSPTSIPGSWQNAAGADYAHHQR